MALGSCMLWGCSDNDGVVAAQPDTDDLVSVSFTMQMPANSRAATPLPAEQLRSLRIVMVDLGYSQDGEWIAPPSVEYNELLTARNLHTGEDDGDVLKIDIPRIHADRMKKLYLIANAEPDVQPSLDIRLADGTEVKGYGDLNLFLPADESLLPAIHTSPIDNAVFAAPRGSYVMPQNLQANEELLTPMTGVYTFSVPQLKEIAEKYPSLNPKLTYPIPGELLLVRAINKIWLEFINATYQRDDLYQPLELLVTEWTLSDVNHGDSFFFGKPGDNNDLFASYSKTETNINEPWMQWIYDEALRSRQNRPYQWLRNYDMPEGEKRSSLVFRPGNYALGKEGLPKDSEGLLLPQPDSFEGSVITSENLPVYFAESHSGSPQKYEMTFTVWQRQSGQQWSNPYTYSVISSTNPADDDTFHLLSLFRNTDVVMQVKFVTGRSGVEIVAELHPYGNVVLNPEFGL